MTAQEELEEARALIGANADATANIARQIAVLIEDQGAGRAPQTTGGQHHFGIGRPVETLGLF